MHFLRNVHIALSGTALALAAVFLPAIVLYPFAAYEGINAAAHEGLRQIVKTRPKKK